MAIIHLLLFSLLLLRAQALYSQGGPVVLLSSSEFGRKVNDDSVWMVEFFAPWCGHCKTLVPAWEASAKALKGVVNVAAVDATQAQDLASQYSVQGFPTILIFGADKSKPEKYQGARTAEAITEAGLRAAQTLVKQRISGKKGGGPADSKGSKDKGPSDVVQLTSSNFEEEVLKSNDPWLVEFFAPWCGHCKNLAPEWAQAATELKGTMKLGAVNCDDEREACGQYDIKGFPTIKFFPPGEKGSPLEYDGGRTSPAIVEWSFGKLDEYGAGPEIVEATSDDVLKASCFSKKICVIAILPHVIDTGAKGRHDYIETVLEVAKKVRSKPMSFVWIQGGIQTKLEEDLGVTMNYPTLVAISHSKMRYAVHRGAFAAEPMVTFLNGVWSGRQRTSELKALPSLVTVDPWDGQDYVPPPEESEEYVED